GPDVIRPQVAGGDVPDLLTRDLEALAQVLLPGADVDADLAGVGVLRREAIDGVSHPPLFPDLLEQPRGGRAAEDPVEQRGGEAPPIGARDPWGREADVVLLGVLALEAQARSGGFHERPANARAFRL